MKFYCIDKYNPCKNLREVFPLNIDMHVMDCKF